MRLRKLLSRKNRKGISLIEVLVALTLTVILVTSMSTLLTPLTAGYNRSQKQKTLDSVGALLMKDLTQRAMGAKTMYVATTMDRITNATIKTNVQICVKDGCLYAWWLLKSSSGDTTVEKSTYLLPSKDSYNGCVVTDLTVKCFTIPSVNKVRGLTLTVTLTNGGVTSTVSRSVRIYNLDFYEDAELGRKSEIFVFSGDKYTTETANKTASYHTLIYEAQGVTA